MSPSTIQNSIVSLIAIIIAASAFGFMVLKTDQQGKELVMQIETLDTQRAQEESFFKLQKIAEDTKDERELLQSHFLLKDSEEVDFLNNVESIAPRAGVALQTSNLSSVVDATDSSEWIQVDFTFTGSRQRVKDFVQILEVLPYVSRLVSVDLTAVSQTEWRARVTMRVRVLAYDS